MSSSGEHLMRAMVVGLRPVLDEFHLREDAVDANLITRPAATDSR